MHVLDDPVWSSLTGPDSTFAVGSENALSYRRDTSPFAAISAASSDALTELAELASAEHPVALVNPGPLPGWTTVASLQGFQMISVEAVPPKDGAEEVVALGEGDIAEMLELTTLTKPGPFLPRTFDLGGYIGVRENGRLIAMAGERMHPTGWAEVSAVCTHPDFRGRGLGARMLLTVAENIRARGAIPFLHVTVENVGASRLYEKLGFEKRVELSIDLVRPAAPTSTI